MNLAVINGPNLNMLGYREKYIYGDFSYKSLISEINHYGKKNFSYINFFQSNSEGDIINHIHNIIKEEYDAIIINPGAFSHYSYAIYDALLIFKGLKVEVHISKVLEREDFRKKLVTANACDKIISGLGIRSYLNAIDFIVDSLK